MLAQAMRIFDAAEAGKSTADILAADMGGTIQCRDVPGTTWTVRGFDVVKSNRADIENSHGYYVSMDATYLGGLRSIAQKNGLVIGETYALQTGADLAVFKLRALEATEAFPLNLSVIGTTTGSGRQLIRIGEAPENAIAGAVEEA
jgi:hypothetical protein